MKKINKKIIIIGGGIGGLLCGAILSKEGYCVKIFEQHYVIGGGLHQFQREGVVFETGIHIVGAFQQGGLMNRLCSYLNIMDQLTLLPEDDDCFELLHIVSDGKTYRIPKGKEHYIESLSKEFPEECDNISRYVRDLYAICDEIKLYHLEYSEKNTHDQSDVMLTSVGDFIDSHTANEKLRAVLAMANPLYGGDRYKTPIYIHALITLLYLEGACRFVGGTQQLADALTQVICQSGGEVHPNNGVTHIEIKKGNIDHILTVDGTKHEADWYISAIHPSSLFKLLDTSKLQRSYWKRLDAIPNSYSFFTLYIIFKANTFPFLNYTGYYQDDYDTIWTHAEYTADTWPKGIMYLTMPTTSHDKFAEKMIVHCVMNFETVQQWEHTTVGKRGQEYEAFKKRCEQQIIEQLKNVYPNINNCIQSVYSASPLTIRDFYNQKEGACYGVKKDCNNMALSQIAVRTKLHNLLMTGQNVNLHGLMGVSITAISTCAELVGMEYLLKKM